MPEGRKAKLKARLFGAPQVVSPGGLPLAGARSVALVALLATAPDMVRARVWLVDRLWSEAPPHRGRANLRQLLHALRQSLGPDFDEIFVLSRDSIGLKPEAVEFLGGPRDGSFLEGLDLPQDGFEDWLRDQRQARVMPRSAAGPVAAPQAPVAAGAPEPEDEPLLPRILVLPFSEASLTPARGLGDALAHELTGQFARSQLTDALSHFTSRNLDRGLPGDLGCDFAMTGQARLADEALTVDVSLLEMPGGKVLWSDRQQTRLRDFLAGQDRLAPEIAGHALRVIMSRSIGQSATTPLPDLAAHRLLMSAVGLMHSFEQSQFLRARDQLDEVIARCPAHSAPRAWLAQWYLLRVYQKWSDRPLEDRTRADEAVRNALDMNPNCPLSLAIDGNILTVFAADFSLARQRFDAAHAVNPSSAYATQLAAVLSTFEGDGAGAVRQTDRAFELSPRDPRRPFFQTLSAGAYVAGGRYGEAVEMAEASLRHNPRHLSAHRCRVIGLQLAGRDGAARQAAAELMRLDPDLRVSAYRRDHPAAETDAIRIWAEALKEAGVPVN